MAVQRVTPEGTTSPVEFRDRPAFRQQPVPVLRRELSIAEQIENLTNDYERARFCREQAEGSRHQWFAGMQRETEYVMARAADGDPRFKNMTPAQLLVTARWRWSRSANSQYLTELENRFTSWAQMYLSFAEVEVLSRHDVSPR